MCICTKQQEQMGRCKKSRICRLLSGQRVFKPRAIPLDQLDSFFIEVDEFEAMRLCDLEGYNQIGAGKAMEISRGTIQRLLNSGRKKIISALLNKKAIIIKNQEE